MTAEVCARCDLVLVQIQPGKSGLGDADHLSDLVAAQIKALFKTRAVTALERVD